MVQTQTQNQEKFIQLGQLNTKTQTEQQVQEVLI